MAFELLSRKKKTDDAWDPNIPLTAEDGPLDRGQQLRQIAAFYADGKLVVSKSHQSSPHILSLLMEAKIAGYPEPQIEAVELNRVQICYERAVSTFDFRNKHDEVRMRREVLDLVADMAKRRVSDIHVVVYEQSCLVRARVAGAMEYIAEWPPEYGHSFCAAAFTMADAADVNYQPYEYQGARVSNRKDLQLPDGVISLRLQFNPTVYDGRAMIMRILYNTDDKTAGDVTALGFTPEQLEDFEFLRSKPYGINVVAGPTGHGKSTTLQRNIIAILKEYNYNIAFYTVEDPPEYPIQGAVQMPVTNASTQEERAAQFTKAIAAAMRSNPDRMMIGEVRDEASAQLAFEAAMTGHQVWTSLHSNDAITIPFRLRDLHVEDYKLCDPTLMTGMVSQRLVRKLCKSCCMPIEERELNYNLISRLETAEVQVERLRKRNPQGCSACNGTGYASRTVVAEVIIPDHTFMELVKKDQKQEAEQYWLTQLNGRNMMEHMVDRLRAGEVDPGDAERVVGPIILPKRRG
ncbi:MAG: Flp pilus assembly complex ATPase component TadA [Rhodospirillales bacterium]|nr:Flp pilus assembly complex ATPase component TadA [Alphaproteobacteria bacterium]MCB9986581.1 Flp pilus assembly complex ATPase component TadA [Rhodospirillales bacterium]USO06888.1 MAG: Flp pilus assembly complex ATPase component TadA [Rhodospirillales bacterium]